MSVGKHRSEIAWWKHSWIPHQPSLPLSGRKGSEIEKSGIAPNMYCTPTDLYKGKWGHQANGLASFSLGLSAYHKFRIISYLDLVTSAPHKSISCRTCQNIRRDIGRWYGCHSHSSRVTCLSRVKRLAVLSTHEVRSHAPNKPLCVCRASHNQ